MPSQPAAHRSRSVHLRVAFAVTALAVVAAACAGAAPSPTPEPTPKPTPTPVAAKVTNPAEAAALVIATSPIFAGAMEYRADVIGASKYWKASPLPTGGYRVEMFVGWGDCMAGCINRHEWTYDVGPDGSLTLVSESGDEVPEDLSGLIPIG